MKVSFMPVLERIVAALRRVVVSGATHHLPADVQREFDSAQDRSERLISWIQLAIALTFAILYALSRKTAPTHMLFTPGAIGFYLAVTVLRLVISYRFRLTAPLLIGSILIDVALLYGLIWSFHLQYQQTASFYLKAPTLLYIFIFIALRALRFEARYVLFAGFAAALGWLGMIGYVVFGDPNNNMITRDYVDYMTSNSILLGAEFDKIISIVLVSLVIALAIGRAKRLLIRAVSDAHARYSLSRFFDASVAQRITGAESRLLAGSGDVRDVTILNFDMRNFTGFAATRPPDEVMHLLATYQARIVPIIQRHGGTIDKFLGDGIMATFGAIEPQPDHAARACRALVEAIAASASGDIGAGPLVCGAAATGRVVVGTVGHADRLEFTVIGAAVNLAAKIEKHNKELASRAVVSAQTYALARAQGFVPKSAHRIAPACRISGLPEPVDLVILA